jgi:carbonic anhydrase/acetyltransferase-like protein (isoleucine patch superfamily)
VELFWSHDSARVESGEIGDRTHVGAFARVLPGARTGADCAILDHAFLGSGVQVGNRVTVGSGARLDGSLEIEDDVTIGPNVIFAADSAAPARTTVGRGASIGANATILPGVAIGERAVIAAGALIGVGEATASSQVRHAVLQPLPRFEDPRGTLAVGEVQTHVPFLIRRFFLIYDVLNCEVRGEHAHRQLHQFLVCIRGSCTVMADDGEHRQEFTLDSPDRGLYLPPLIWSVQHQHSPDAVLLVLASAPYDPADYVHDYRTFLDLVRHSR